MSIGLLYFLQCTNPNCPKTYTDLEADRLLDPDTLTLNCMICGCEVEEQQSSAPVKDARALVAKYIMINNIIIIISITNYFLSVADV